MRSLLTRPLKIALEPSTVPDGRSTFLSTATATATATVPKRAGAPPLVGFLARSRAITRRHLQVALGLFWLLDGALQAQPFMFTRGFATQVIAGVGQGQSGFVAGPLDWAANIIAAHPVAWNVPFAAIQLLLGVGLLVPRTARLTL